MLASSIISGSNSWKKATTETTKSCSTLYALPIWDDISIIALIHPIILGETLKNEEWKVKLGCFSFLSHFNLLLELILIFIWFPAM